MSKKPPRLPPKFPDAQKLQDQASKAIMDFRNGAATELESALGMLYLGHAFGWKVLYIIHSASTVRKYERILGIVAKEEFPEETHHSDRSIAFGVAKKVSNFWKAVRGEVEAEGIRDKNIDPA